MKLFWALAFAAASLGVALATTETAAATKKEDGNGVAAQLTGFLLDNARSLFTHDLPLPKDWAVWITSISATAETEGGDDTASADNWWFSSPVNRPPPDNGNNGNGPPPGRPGPPGGRPPRPGNNGNGGNGNGGGRPNKMRRALQWANEHEHDDGGYGYPIQPPTPAPTNAYGSFNYEEDPDRDDKTRALQYYPGEHEPTPAPTNAYGSVPWDAEPGYGGGAPTPTPAPTEPVYEEDPEHDKMGVVPGAEPYRPKSPLVRALENVQFKKARAGQQNLRGSSKA